MAGLHELLMFCAVSIAVISVAIHYVLAKRSGTGLFYYGLLSSSAIAVSAIALAAAPADSVAGAFADLGILLAGALAFATARWLEFAFVVAGGDDDG